MEVLKKPIAESCVWKVSDFKDENEWTYIALQKKKFLN